MLKQQVALQREASHLERERLFLLQEQAAAESNCGRCGQRFQDATRVRPRPGKMWHGTLETFREIGVCPRCYFEFKHQEERDFSSDEWATYVKDRIVRITTAREAADLHALLIEHGLADLAAEAGRLKERLAADEEAARQEREEARRQEQLVRQEQQRQRQAEEDRQQAIRDATARRTAQEAAQRQVGAHRRWRIMGSLAVLFLVLATINPIFLQLVGLGRRARPTSTPVPDAHPGERAAMPASTVSPPPVGHEASPPGRRDARVPRPRSGPPAPLASSLGDGAIRAVLEKTRR
jgi:hypothetical protein